MRSDGFAVASAACPAAAEAFARYCGIVSGGTDAETRQGLIELSQVIDGIEGMRDAIFADIPKLMQFVDLEDTSLFNCFYNFVFFICRKNGQKSITIKRAVKAWRIVLNGRFRLLDRWCNFVDEYQRHNISEDTWQQLLAFSRCINENLEGYDPREFITPVAAAVRWNHDVPFPIHLKDWILHLDQRGNVVLSLTPMRM